MFEDDKVFDLGLDETGRRLHEIVRRALKGRYYPPDAVRVTGRFALEDRAIREGDRLVQKAPLFCRMGGPLISSAVEVFVAEQTPTSFRSATSRPRGTWAAGFGALTLCFATAGWNCASNQPRCRSHGFSGSDCPSRAFSS